MWQIFRIVLLKKWTCSWTFLLSNELPQSKRKISPLIDGISEFLYFQIKRSFTKELTLLQKQPTEVLYKKGVLWNFVKFIGLRPANLLKKRLWHRCFPVNFTKFLRTPFLQNTSGRLLLFIVQWPYRMTLTLITFGFLFHFILVGGTEDEKSQTCHSQVLRKFFYDTLKTQRQLCH